MIRPALFAGLLIVLMGFTCSTDPTAGAACGEHPLHQKLQTESSLRVIVTLARSEGQRIEVVQARFLDLLDGTEHEVLRRPEHAPVLALRVGEAAFCRAVESPLVTGVQEDVPQPPSGS